MCVRNTITTPLLNTLQRFKFWCCWCLHLESPYL